jgi:hypothetical protein
MERQSYITRRFTQILKETISEKADELMGKLKFNPPGTSFDYVQEEKGMCNECGKPYTMMEGEKGDVCECGDPYSVEVKERLVGGQRKLDRNKNNRIDSEDFKMLRKSKKKEMREYTMGDDKLEVVKPYGDMSTDSPKIKPGEKNQVKNVGFDYQKKVSKEFDDYELQEETIYEIELGETETDESREFAYAAMMAKKKGKKTFDLDGKTFDVKGNSKVDETYYRIKVDGEMATFSENEMIDIIESIVKEEKSNNIKRGTEPNGYAEYEKAHKADGKNEDKYFKDLAKKMNNYIKDGSKQKKFDTNPKQFPKGNGELGEMDKKAYEIDQEGTDYNYEVAGLNIPDYDESKPKKETIEKQIKGSSTNGNDQSYANAVNTGVNDKFAEYFENDQLAKWKDESYGRVPSPVYADNPNSKGKGKGKTKLKEEFSRMQELMGYTKKTQ